MVDLFQGAKGFIGRCSTSEPARVCTPVRLHFFLISRWRVWRRRYLLYFMSSSLPGVLRLLCGGPVSRLLRLPAVRSRPISQANAPFAWCIG